MCRRLETQQIAIVGGLEFERLHPWHPLGTLQRDLIRGREAYQALQVTSPQVFARFGAGMTMEYPTHLKSAGYTGTLLHAFSNGHYPVSSQAKISWEASDTTNIDTISGCIFDAASCRSLFHVVGELAKQFDHHQVPTLVGVHWPSRVSVAYQDVVNATRRTNAFGEWSALDKYFETTGFVYSHQNFTAQDFRFDWPSNDREFAEKAAALKRSTTAKRSVGIDAKLRSHRRASPSFNQEKPG